MLNPSIAKLLPYFKPHPAVSEPEKENNIHVDELVGSVIFLYEKLRNIIDFKEERLLRKEAIHRILKRRLFLEDIRKLMLIDLEKKVAESLIKELIQARYIANDSLPKKKNQEIEKVIDRYLLLMQFIGQKNGKSGDKAKLFNWLIGLAACEIEERLVPAEQEKALAGCMYEIMGRRLRIADGQINEKDKEIQLYAAIYRTLLKYDQTLVSYLLLKLYYPGWLEAAPDDIRQMARDIEKWQSVLSGQAYHPLREKFNNLCRRQAILFSMLRDTILANQDDYLSIIGDPKLLAEKVRKVSLKKHKESRRKLFKSSVHAIIYIFLTKMAIALAIEVPFDIYVLQAVNYLPILINLIFHPLLMFFITMTFRFSVNKNTEKIVKGIEEIAYQEKGRDVRYVIKVPLPYRTFLNFFFQLVYWLAFVVSFGILIYVLRYLQFSVLSGALFLIFLSLVSFFGIRIRATAKELLISEKRASIIGALFDFFTLPIVRVGRRISEEFSRLNVFLFILDYLIEAPLKTLMSFIESWFGFMKERKEETINT
ncbi:MAG: hypothetical protein V1684_00730 [bacterium]